MTQKQMKESVIVDVFEKAIIALMKNNSYKKDIAVQVTKHENLLKRLKDA